MTDATSAEFESGAAKQSGATRRPHRKGGRSRRDARRKSRRIVLWSGAAVVLLVLACAAWVGIRAYMAKGELESAVPLASQLKDAALANDIPAVTRTASELHGHATRAASLTSDPIWRAAEFVPVVGANLSAAREISGAVRDLSTDAVGPLTRLVATVDISDFKPVDGAISLQPLVDAQPSVSLASAALLDAQAKVDAIDASETVSAVKNAVDRLSNQIDELVPPVQALSNAVLLAPSMLGEDGPRDYLLLFQNPAELRSTGGIPGALALVHTENGKIELTQQSSSSQFPHYEAPVLELPEETRGLYGDITGEYIQDVTLTPNYALTAQLAKQMWKERYGSEVDGVISIDPVALSYLLEATGPVGTVTGDELTSQNAVSLLLNEAYMRYPVPAQQDAFFAASAKAVFDKVSTGSVDPQKLIEGLTRAGTERRILIWNAREEEQSRLEGTYLAGELVGESEKSPKIGVFLNDATGSKMDYYLSVNTQVGSMSCRDDKLRNVGISVTLHNRAPANAGSVLPAYITGDGDYGVAPGYIRTAISVYAAPGMVNLGVSDDNGEVEAHSATDTKRSVNQVTVELAPGESKTYYFAYIGSTATIGPGDLQITPTINMNETSELALTCESALW